MIVSALMAIYASTQNSYFFLAAIFPILIFWFLDAYYLNQELKFRGFYDNVAGVADNPKEIQTFAMRPDLYTVASYSYWDTLFSPTIRMYPIMIIGLAGIFMYFEFCINKGV